MTGRQEGKRLETEALHHRHRLERNQLVEGELSDDMMMHQSIDLHSWVFSLLSVWAHRVNISMQTSLASLIHVAKTQTLD